MDVSASDGRAARLARASLGCCAIAAALSALFVAGCATQLRAPVDARAATNPFLLPVGSSPQSFETTWERCVDVLHQYKFEIERENRLAGTIETTYKVGAGVAEPWHPDSPSLHTRLESTFQSIRRKVLIRIMREDGGAGYLVGVEALKEREDTGRGVATSRGDGRFNEYSLAEDNYSKAIGESEYSGWVPLGHDLELERALIQSLQLALTQ